jgi:sarcosine oxidase subunit gamma
MPVLPDQFHRKSFVYPRLLGAGAEFDTVADAAVAVGFPGRATPALGLADLSPLPRTGVRGHRALAWLDEQGWPVPGRNNEAVATGAGDLVLRLGDAEALVAAAPAGDGTAVRTLAQAIPGSGAWHVPRGESHCAFALHGDDAVACLAKLCGIDLRPRQFPAGAIAQTSVARLNTIVCRPPSDAQGRTFHLFADSAAALWFWDVLADAAAEFGGGPLGVRDLP